MAEVLTEEYWETLSIKKGYQLLLSMGVDKRKARWEALKGVPVFIIKSKTK